MVPLSRPVPTITEPPTMVMGASILQDKAEPGVVLCHEYLNDIAAENLICERLDVVSF